MARTGCSSPRSAQLHYPKRRPRPSLIGKVSAGRLGSAEMGRRLPSAPTARPRPPGCWNTECAVFPEATAAHLTQKGTDGLRLRPPLRPLQLPALASESWGSPHGTEKKAVAHQGQGTRHRRPPLPSPTRRPVQSRVLADAEAACPLPHPTAGPLVPVNTPVHTPLAALKVAFYFHSLYFSTGEEFLLPRLNMTFDKDVFVVLSQDTLGDWC